MSKEYKASELAEIAGGTVKGDPNRVATGVNSLKAASEQEASFLHSAKYLAVLRSSKAGIVLVPADWKHEPGEGQTLILCPDPDKAFTKVCALYAPDPIEYEMTVSPLAYVHPTAKIAEGVHIGPYAVVMEGAEIGAGAKICACAYVGQYVKIGEDATLFPNVSIMHRCVIGRRTIIHAGTTIGSDGFGYNASFRGLIKVPQNGIVRIDADVEIGANCTIDRARFGMTWIKKGVKIDNLVHIAHNVTVGESSALIGQCGIAGSAEIGRGVVVAAQAGVNGHITLGDGSKVAGASAVQKSLAPGATAFGTPAESQDDFLERHMLPRTVRKLKARIEALEAALNALKNR